ncbi:hypothetical protein PMIN05_002136 [Paraphaeosphaeria minitans]
MDFGCSDTNTPREGARSTCVESEGFAKSPMRTCGVHSNQPRAVALLPWRHHSPRENLGRRIKSEQFTHQKQLEPCIIPPSPVTQTRLLTFHHQPHVTPAADSSMRLIHVGTLEIKAFSQQHVPDYAILSHTWGPDEVTFQEMSLITRMNSLSQAFTSQRSDDSQEGDASIVYESGAIMVAMEMLVHGGWGAGTNVPNTSEEALMGREGYRKIIQSAKEAKNLGYQWVWIDVCLPPFKKQHLCQS